MKTSLKFYLIIISIFALMLNLSFLSVMPAIAEEGTEVASDTTASEIISEETAQIVESTPEENSNEPAGNTSLQLEDNTSACNGEACGVIEDNSSTGETGTQMNLEIIDPAANMENVITIPVTICGDGIVTNGEQCDDGNLSDNDGCSSLCTIEESKANEIMTGFIRSITGGEKPVIKGIWEMDSEKIGEKYSGTDSNSKAGAQFMPSGQYAVDKKITLCAVITDPDGLNDIDNASAELFYPEFIALGASHPSGHNGCGERIEEILLSPLSQAEGYELICERIKNINNNLPAWNKNSATEREYGYEEICANDGELKNGQAAVYCGSAGLSYSDPAGEYRARFSAKDKTGTSVDFLNNFTYLEITNFETDFKSIFYGNVKEDAVKTLKGDKNWQSSLPTIRNTGNTRLQISVRQNDMGLGKTNGVWNVIYSTRIGERAALTEYSPETITLIDKPLELGENNEIEFSIKVLSFPESHKSDNFGGNMSLSAVTLPYLTCLK